MTGSKDRGRRVAHILRKYNPLEWGGTETHVVALTRQLSGLGWRPEVHAPRGPAAPDSALDPTVPLVRYRAFCPFLGPAEKRRALVADAGNLATFDEPLRLARDRGLLLAHLHTSGRIGGAVRTAMRLTGRPYIISVHGPLLSQRTWLQADTARRLSGLIDLGQPIGAILGSRRVIRDAARVLTFNEEERQALAGVVGDRVLRLDQGVDLERLAVGRADRARRRWPFLADAPVVALIGRLVPQKNHLLAIRAFARGAPPDHQLVFAGAALDPAWQGTVERQILECGLASRVHLLGNLGAAEEVPDLLALAKLVVMPSLHEAFGLIALEAWASTRPVLMAIHSGLADLAEAIGEDGLCVPSLDDAAWAAALRQCLSSPERLEVAARAGAALVRRRFSWDAVARRVQDIYEAVLEERRAAA